MFSFFKKNKPTALPISELQEIGLSAVERRMQDSSDESIGVFFEHDGLISDYRSRIADEIQELNQVRSIEEQALLVRRKALDAIDRLAVNTSIVTNNADFPTKLSVGDALVDSNLVASLGGTSLTVANYLRAYGSLSVTVYSDLAIRLEEIVSLNRWFPVYLEASKEFNSMLIDALNAKVEQGDSAFSESMEEVIYLAEANLNQFRENISKG